MMQRKKAEPSSLLLSLKSSASRGHHRAEETHHGHQAGEKNSLKGTGVLKSTWTIKDSKTPRKSNLPNDHCRKGC